MGGAGNPPRIFPIASCPENRLQRLWAFPALSASKNGSPGQPQPAKARRTAGFRASVSDSSGKGRLGGGAGSLGRTRLRRRFPVLQGKYRDFFANPTGFRPLTHRKLLNLFLLSCKFPTRRNRELVCYIRELAGNSLERGQSPNLWLNRPVRQLPNPNGPRAGIGHKWSFTWTWPNVWLLIRNLNFEPIAAAQNSLSVGYVGFAIWKRKKLALSDFVAF